MANSKARFSSEVFFLKNFILYLISSQVSHFMRSSPGYFILDKTSYNLGKKMKLVEREIERDVKMYCICSVIPCLGYVLKTVSGRCHYKVDF